jgi:hypothetical protein
MERFIKNINAALSKSASEITIGGIVSVNDLEKRILSAIGQLEEALTNIDCLHKAHIPTIEVNVTFTNETPTKEAVMDAWEEHCRATRRNFIPAVAVIMGKHEAEVRANNGTKLGIYEYSTKKFK